MKGPYDDIIHLPHPTSIKHPRMSSLERAAQFSPFAALRGYGAAVRETARLTDPKAELTDEEKAALDRKLRLAAECRREVEITYFLPDGKKAGGAYVTAAGVIKKVDALQHTVVMADKTSIPMEDILEIQGEALDALLYGEAPAQREKNY